MRDVDSDDVVENHASEMSRRPRARRTVLHPGLVGLGVGDKLLEIVHRQVFAGDQRNRRFGDQGHRREVGRRVIKRPLIEGLALRMGADARQHERVAVGRRIGHAPGASHAAGATDIFDHDLLSEQFATEGIGADRLDWLGRLDR